MMGGFRPVVNDRERERDRTSRRQNSGTTHTHTHTIVERNTPTDKNELNISLFSANPTYPRKIKKKYI